MDLSAAQSFMADHALDAWLLYDFRGSNPIFWRIIGDRPRTTRRCFLFIPREGAPSLIVSPLDVDLFASLDAGKTLYTGWQELHGRLRDVLAGCRRIAMEYSPGGTLPIVSYADAGTVEFVRSLGLEVVSSAEIHQHAAARWSEAAIASHRSAVRGVEEAKDAAFAFIADSLKASRAIAEHEVQRFILDRFAERNLQAGDPPIVAVNAHSGNPHYQPPSTGSASIRPGDWVLIDLWAKHPGEQDVFADITWVGCAGAPSARHEQVFRIVKDARDAAVGRLQEAWRAGQTLAGWQVDQAARGVIAAAGFGERFFHRTGHSMGPGPTVHALGVNLDDFETRDTRPIVPGVGFSVEPGIYLDDFGVRSEINVFVDPKQGPLVTTRLQQQILRLA